MARPAPQARSRSRATKKALIKPIKRVSREMRRSVAAGSGESGGLAAIAASRKPPENVAHAGIETNASQHEKQNRLGVKPAVEKIAEKPAYNDGRKEDKGQFHGDCPLVGP